MSDPDAQPSANLRSALAGFDAFSRGDLERSLQTLHPEIEWHLLIRLPDLPFDKEVYRGRDEVRIVWESFRSTWEELTLDLEEILWEGDDTIVARARFIGRGEGSGVSVDRVVYYVIRMRDELLAMLKGFDKPAEALAFAGAPDDA